MLIRIAYGSGSYNTQEWIPDQDPRKLYRSERIWICKTVTFSSFPHFSYFPPYLTSTNISFRERGFFSLHTPAFFPFFSSPLNIFPNCHWLTYPPHTTGRHIFRACENLYNAEKHEVLSNSAVGRGGIQVWTWPWPEFGQERGREGVVLAFCWPKINLKNHPSTTKEKILSYLYAPWEER